MRRVTKLFTVIAAVGLTASTAACGSDKPGPQHTFGRLTGGTTTIALDSTFVTGLARLGVTPTPIRKAKVAIPNLIFPITGGHLDVYKAGDATPPVTGEVDHNGSGIDLTVGKGKKRSVIGLKNLVVDFDNSDLTGDVTINGNLFGRDAELFTLDTTDMAAPTSTDSAATLSGIKVRLSGQAALALNTALKSKTNKVKGGLLVGLATVRAAGKS